MPPPFDLGEFLFLDDRFGFRDRVGHRWSVRFDGLVVVGEFLENVLLAPTPMDLQWAFVLRDGTWCTAPVRAAGCDTLAHALHTRLGAGLDSRLTGTGIASRITWPAALRDRELFVFETLEPRSLLDRCRTWVAGQSVNVSLAPHVQTHIHRSAHTA